MDTVIRNLKLLRISSLAEWDVLVFIHRHGTSLASAENIARLLGYTPAIVSAALDSLSSKALIERSRNSHGVRVYRNSSAIYDRARRSSFEELISMADDRPGRLLLIRNLPQNAPDPQMGIRSGLHLAGRKGRRNDQR